jgi:bacterial/archaeal transporter family-2 protein
MEAARNVKHGSYLALALLGGICITVQIRLNGELGVALGTPWLAACVSFGGGLLIAAIATLVTRGGRQFLREGRIFRRAPWWVYAGGLGGAVYVVAVTAAGPVLGIAVVTFGALFGQFVGGLIVDSTGLGAITRPVTRSRLMGAAVALVAVLVAQAGRSIGQVAPLLVSVVAAAGIGVSLQTALNGRLRIAIGSVPAATMISFAVGSCAIVAVCICLQAYSGNWQPAWPTDPLLYLGGVLGVAYVGISAVAGPVLGVFRFTVVLVLGQLIGALVLDAVWPTVTTGSVFALATSVGLTIIAVFVSNQQTTKTETRQTVTSRG